MGSGLSGYLKIALIAIIAVVVAKLILGKVAPGAASKI